MAKNSPISSEARTSGSLTIEYTFIKYVTTRPRRACISSTVHSQISTTRDTREYMELELFSRFIPLTMNWD